MSFKVGDRVVWVDDARTPRRVGTVIEARADEMKLFEQGVPGTRAPSETGWLSMAAFRRATYAEIDAADGPAPGEPHD